MLQFAKFFSLVVLLGLDVSPADEKFLGLLKVDDVAAAREILFFKGVVLPEEDRLPFVLDGQGDFVLVDSFCLPMRLAPESSDIIIEKLRSDHLFKIIASEGWHIHVIIPFR